MVLIDESTKHGLLCSGDSCSATSGFSAVYGSGNETLELCCRTVGDLTSTLAGIQMYGDCAVTAGQLLPFSWNRRCVRVPFDLSPLCLCIKSKSITGTEWVLRRMIVPTECGCINLIALFFPLLELLCPIIQRIAQPCYITVRK